MDLKEERKKELLFLADSLSIYSKEILSFREAAKYMGLSESFLYKLSSTRKIAHSKPNNKLIFFKKKDLDSWLLQNPIQSAKQVEQEVEDYLSRKNNSEE